MTMLNLIDTNLSDEEEALLKGYQPDVITKYAPVGPEPEEGEEDTREIVKTVIDNRDLVKHRLYLKKILKRKTSAAMLKEFPIHKQLNYSALSSEEQSQYTEVRNHYLTRYEAFKSDIANAQTLDDLDVVSRSLNSDIAKRLESKSIWQSITGFFTGN